MRCFAQGLPLVPAWKILSRKASIHSAISRSSRHSVGYRPYRSRGARAHPLSVRHTPQIADDANIHELRALILGWPESDLEITQSNGPRVCSAVRTVSPVTGPLILRTASTNERAET